MMTVVPILQGAASEWQWQMHPMWWMWGAGGFVMLLMMLLFWGVMIVALVMGVRWLLSTGRPPAHDGALAILRERYARGEITREQFETMRRDLGASPR